MRKTSSEVLKHLLGAYNSFDAQWAEQSREFDQQYCKGLDLNLTRKDPDVGQRLLSILLQSCLTLRRHAH